MKTACEVDRHPRGEATGKVRKTFNTGARYVEVICPECGRVQGIRLDRSNEVRR